MDSLLSSVGACSAMIVADFSVKQAAAGARARGPSATEQQCGWFDFINIYTHIEKYTNFFFDD